MRTRELIQNLTQYAVTAASTSDSDAPALIAQARSEIDLCVENRQLKVTEATAKLERLQGKTQTALLNAGLTPYDAIHFTHRLGLPNPPFASGLAFSARQASQANMMQAIPICSPRSKVADAAHFAGFECRDGSVVFIAKNALDEFDSQLFSSRTNSKLVSSPSDTVCTIPGLTYKQLVGIKKFAETSTLSSTHSHAELKLLRKAAIFIASESMLDAVVHHAREMDFIGIRKILLDTPKKYIRLDHLEASYLKNPEKEEISGFYSLNTRKHEMSWVKMIECLDELNALESAMVRSGFREVSITTDYSEITYKYKRPELSSKKVG